MTAFDATQFDETQFDETLRRRGRDVITVFDETQFETQFDETVFPTDECLKWHRTAAAEAAATGQRISGSANG